MHNAHDPSAPRNSTGLRGPGRSVPDWQPCCGSCGAMSKRWCYFVPGFQGPVLKPMQLVAILTATPAEEPLTPEENWHRNTTRNTHKHDTRAHTYVGAITSTPPSINIPMFPGDAGAATDTCISQLPQGNCCYLVCALLGSLQCVKGSSPRVCVSSKIITTLVVRPK